MSPEQKAERLVDIADEVQGVGRLVLVGRLAIDHKRIDRWESEEVNALSELLAAIDQRLRAVA